MKKKLLVLVLLLFSICTLNSLEYDYSLSLGVIGGGFNSDFKTIDGYFYGRFLNLMYQSNVGLGFSISPLVFFYKDTDNQSFTFVNGMIFYNLLIQTSESFILGPQIAVNAVRYRHPAFVEFRSGLLFSFRSKDISYARNSIFAIDIFFVELGYKYNKTDSHGFYAHIGIDLIAALKFIGSVTVGASDDNEWKGDWVPKEPPWKP